VVAAEEPVEIPRDLRQLSAEARRAMRSAALSGSRGLLIDAAVPTLDPSLKAFDPALLARFAIECAREMRSLVSLTAGSEASGAIADVGRILVLVPGLACAMAATALAAEGEEEGKWRSAQAEAGRSEDSGLIEVTSLGMAGAPPLDQEPPAAVLVVGLMRATDSDDKTGAIGRAWLRLASGLGAGGTGRGGTAPLTLGLNLRCGELLEVSEFVTACALVPYAVVRRSSRGGEDGEPDVEQAKVLLYRVHPEPFRVLVAPPGGDGAMATYSEVVTLDKRCAGCFRWCWSYGCCWESE